MQPPRSKWTWWREGEGGKERQKGKNCLSRFSGTIPNLEKKEIKKKHMTGQLAKMHKRICSPNLCLVWVVCPCRCPTAEWRLRDKRDNAPRQVVPERQRSRARGDKKKYAHAVLPFPACMAFESWGNRTHGRWAMHAHHCSRARPTPERSSAFASPPVLNCDTCKIFSERSYPISLVVLFGILTGGKRRRRGRGVRSSLGS